LEKRQIIETTKEKLLPNNRYGIVSKGLNWLPLSNDENLELLSGNQFKPLETVP
jgi:hypothetical protein